MSARRELFLLRHNLNHPSLLLAPCILFTSSLNCIVGRQGASAAIEYVHVARKEATLSLYTSIYLSAHPFIRLFFTSPFSFPLRMSAQCYDSFSCHRKLGELKMQMFILSCFTDPSEVREREKERGTTWVHTCRKIEKQK